MPIKTISWKRAMKLLYGTDKAEVVELYSDATNEYEVSILRLIHRAFPVNPFATRTKFYRRQVFARDKFTCQYCLSEKKSELTIDHIMPKSRGGPTSYANCVTACRKCNQRKSDHTPEEVNMKLAKTPQAPIRGIVINASDLPEEWAQYLR